jgi:hypothetical protein
MLVICECEGITLEEYATREFLRRRPSASKEEVDRFYAALRTRASRFRKERMGLLSEFRGEAEAA